MTKRDEVARIGDIFAYERNGRTTSDKWMAKREDMLNNAPPTDRTNVKDIRDQMVPRLRRTGTRTTELTLAGE